MDFRISKRHLIRISCFVAAIILVLSILAYNYAKDAQNNQRTLEYHYMKSISDLTSHVEAIDSELNKAMYVNSPAMLSMLSTRLWREAGLAKEALSILPIEYLSLQNTNKLLSQIGDYCISLSKTFARGQKLTADERDNLKKLNDYCDTMLSETVAVNDGIQTGSISLIGVKNKIAANMKDDEKTAEIGNSFFEFEEGFTSYPTLIYDGPFSDHILQKEPIRLKNEKNISRAQAKEKAAKVSSLTVDKISDGNDEDSKMPSYLFTAQGVDIAITKKGGLLSYMLCSREVSASSISIKQAQDNSRKFLDSLGIGILETTYYEISNNIITTNYAYKQDNVLVYTDLIKVSVALDNGEIVGFDARGYIVNNCYRNDITPLISLADASKLVSSNLTIENSQLCIIPSGGLNELLCYEFKCKAADSSNNEAAQDFLVYINAATGAEERILILLITENGQLTI